MASSAPANPTALQPTPLPQSDPEILAHVTTYVAARCSASPIYAFLLGTPSSPQARLVHASRGLVAFRLVLGPQHLNSSGGLHGSVSATIVDWAGGLAIAAWDRRDATGVSVDINVSYLSSARLGDEVEIEGRIEKVGTNLAFTQVGIWKVDGAGNRAEVVVLGRHTKFVRSKK